MTAYVHIGTPKTGTTTIQKFLSINSCNIRKQGVVYIKSIEKNYQHWLLVDIVYDIIKKYPDGYSDKCAKYIKNSRVFELLKKEILYYNRKGYDFFIFSTEGITREFYDIKFIYILKYILNILGFSKIYIVVYFRNIINFLSSFSIQNVRTGNPTISSDMINPELNPVLFVMNYKWIIDKYSEVFGKSNLIIRVFDYKMFIENNLLKDFIYVLKLKWDSNFYIPEDQNKALNLIGVELQRRINKILPNEYYNNISCIKKQINPLRNFISSFIKKHFSFSV